MAVTQNSLITPQSPVVGIGTLTSPTGITSRANITGTTGLVQLTPTSTNGKRIDYIKVQSKATSVAGTLCLWIYNGTTSFLYDEILISAITASTTVAAFEAEASYLSIGSINLPATYQLFISVTVANDLSVFAHGGDY